MIIIILSIIAAFAGGFYAGVKNASSSKVEKAVDILKALKGK